MADSEPMVNMHMAEEHAVTVGGHIEVLLGSTETGRDGMDRGIFSRINVSYDKTLDSGLEIGGRIGYHLGNRNSAEKVKLRYQTEKEVQDALAKDPEAAVGMVRDEVTVAGTAPGGAPDVLYMTIGGGFGTVSIGAHPGANCATLPRPVAFTQSLNLIYHLQFSKIRYSNLLLQEPQYCATPESVSYATPNISGFKAMVTYAPNADATQSADLQAATSKVEDLINATATWSSAMGGADISLGAGIITSSGTAPEDTQTVAGTIGFGGITVGASWFSNDKTSQDGYTVGAKYALGNLTPAITYASQDTDTATLIGVGKGGYSEETSLIIGATYGLGGGLAVFAEYWKMEQTGFGVEYSAKNPAGDGQVTDKEDTLLIAGVQLSF